MRKTYRLLNMSSQKAQRIGCIGYTDLLDKYKKQLTMLFIENMFSTDY